MQSKRGLVRRILASPFLKRLIDVIFSLIGILIFSPLMLFISFIILLSMGRPIFFKQIRSGLNGKPFLIYKFITMLDLRDESGNLLPDDLRITSLGRILRYLRLDELPELFNILKGDMSLVGPRPTLPEQVLSYNDFQKKRLSIRPGLTGWAQINGNTKLSWEDRILLDIWYIDHWDLLIDIKIIYETIKVVFNGERINPLVLEEARKYAIHLNRSS